MTDEERLKLIHREFLLDGDSVVRRRTGQPVTPDPSRKSYAQVSIKGPDGKHVVMRLHRVKFALAYGFLPATVDHRGRDPKDDSLGNLRPATRVQNGANILRGGPVGVRRKGQRWSAYATWENQQVYLGSYDSEEAAQRVADGVREHFYGEYHVPRRTQIP